LEQVVLDVTGHGADRVAAPDEPIQRPDEIVWADGDRA
jgi:hypothetical protein